MVNQSIIENFLKELEQFFLEEEEKKEQIKALEQENQFLKSILNSLLSSKVDFVNSLAVQQDNVKTFFSNLLEKLLPEEQRKRILEEINNLYYLNITGLTNQEEVLPQKESALKALEELIKEIQKYLQKSNIDRKKEKLEEIERTIENIIALGDKFDKESITSPIEDIDFFEKMVEKSSLTNEEKIILISIALTGNITLYKELLEEKEEQVEFEIEEEKERVEEKILKENEPSYTISEEQLARLEELLHQEEVIKKVVGLVAEEYSTTDYREIEEEVLRAILQLAKEEIKASMIGNNLSPEEALNLFYTKNDQSYEHTKQTLNGILKEEDSSLSSEEMESIIKEATAFQEKNERKIRDMSYVDKELLENYIQGLYREKSSRITIYKSKYLNNDQSQITTDAAYEISYFLDFLRRLKDGEEDQILKRKTCQRIKEVMESLEVVIKDTEKDFVMEEEKEKEKRNIFFLMKNEEKSFLEDDIRFDKGSKGISRTFYKEIEDNLEELSSFENKLINSVRGTWKNLHNMGVKYKEGRRTSIFYIPINNDIIILGIGYINGKDDSFKEQNARVKFYEDKIKQLIEALNSPLTRQEELEKANKMKERILNALHRKTDETEDDLLEEMLTEEEPVEELEPQTSTK